MTVLTLRGLSPESVRRLKTEAKKAGISMNRLVLRRLESDAQGPFRPHVHHDLDALFGTMTAADSQVIEKAVATQRRIDPELWK